MMKNIIRFFGLICMFTLCATEVYAVTDQEMEQARTIAAKAYLRYANNGSGYLDEQNPKTMDELRKGLKAKEVENLKSFTAVAVPKDYAGWDKNKLVEYWSVTFFNSPGLIEAGKGARGVVKKRVSSLTVSAPGSGSEKNVKEPEKEATASGNIPVSLVEDDGTSQETAAAAAELEKRKQEADSIAALVAADTGMSDEPVKKSSGTWIYVTILVALIGVVVWLVVYASKTMKNKDEERSTGAGSTVVAPVAPSAAQSGKVSTAEKSEQLKSEFARTIARKNEEIQRLVGEVESLGMTCRGLEDENARLEGENARLTAEVNALQHELAAAAARSSAAVSVAQSPAQTIDSPVVEKPVVRQKRSIYLGRVNARGLFVRADRTLNPEGSVYLIETEDGYSGTFRVVNVPEVCERVLENPAHWLAGGCVAHDLMNTAGMSEIHTESTGDAIFESGCWRVVRKAKIAYS